MGGNNSILFETYYKQLLEYAKMIITKRKLDIPPEEIVNEAFVKFYETGEDFDIVSVKKLVSYSAGKECDLKLRQNSFDETFVRKEKFINGEYQCKGCLEIMPAAAFRIARKNNYKFLRQYCGKCLDKQTIKWRKENKEMWNAYIKSRYIARPRTARPIHDLWKEANRRYQKKQKESLTDAYIRNILKGTAYYRKNNVPITVEAISAKRKELMDKIKNQPQKELTIIKLHSIEDGSIKAR